MGLEATCKVVVNGTESIGKAHCGDGEIDFRGDFRFRWKWSEISILESQDGVLTVGKGEDVANFHIGDAADKWLFQIRNPKSRLDKFGLKPGHRYQVWGEFDEKFASELAERAGTEGDAPLDIVFVRMDEADDLQKLSEARAVIEPNGMIWAVWPKGRKTFREDDIRNYGLANGLVDVKVASFSNELSALKLVIPVALRNK
ncbi:MAG: DUF3052 family protein [Chlorobia bacterium]|nr:DUF3052 family protein [Fimbriimonadaceae bacterium]